MVEVVKQALEEGRRAHVLVNNRAERTRARLAARSQGPGSFKKQRGTALSPF